MIFKINNVNRNGVRLGHINGKSTPRFFMINNFGGGGTNVSRFFIYSSLFEEGKSELLLNYYYLNTKFPKTPAFNTDLLKNILSFNDIRSFIDHARKNLIEVKGNCLRGFRYQTMKWNPLVLVDSGSGNIFRDLSPSLSENNFKDIFLSEIRDYINFCETLNIDAAIGLDIAGKYTWKKGETADRDYLTKLKIFSKPEWNLMVNKLFLQEMPEKSVVAYYAAVHGDSPIDYLNYLNLILSIENELGRKYSGFAIGGMGNTSRNIVYETVEMIRNRLNELEDDRPIHILGVGALQNIIPLSINGADTFDCHSPWRRANEDKLVIPLLNSDFEIITKDENYWNYIPINQISELDCDCEVCKRYSISKLRELKNGTIEEKYYFRILAYKHNIHQQEILCELVRTETNFENLIEKFPKSSYKEKMLSFSSKHSQKPLI
nr:tRNA-guanine transglycosylase [Candidatus Freyarchaeota archaeon]